jgi:hypothetical protein
LCDSCLKRGRDKYKALGEAGICQKCKKSPANATKAFCVECREKQRKISLERYRGVKQKVFDHYGRTCECCGEGRDYFLTIDHINGDGNKHRKEVGSSNIYDWLVKHEFPSGFQVLCMNCNCAKRSRSTCPCKEDRKFKPFTWVA